MHIIKSHLNKKSAFTLAETLITIGIIGVVAAITLPQLTAKYQQIAFSTAFKKEYNVLNNAINYLNLNDGLRECYFSLARGDSGWYYNAVTSNCPTLKQSLISKLNLQPIENDVSYTDKEQVSSNGGVVINNSANYYVSNMKAYSLPDGAVVMFRNSSTSVGYTYVIFVIDVNGKKGPNKWGYDAFWLTLVKKGDTLSLTDEYASLSEKGGSLPRNILLNKWSNYYYNGNFGVWK